MVTDENFVFGYALDGLPIQIAMEGDGVLLSMSRHPYSKNSGVEVVHVCDRRHPLVEGDPTVNDLPANL